MNHPQPRLIPVTDPAAEIALWQQRIESVLERWLPPETQDPVRLHRAMRYASLGGGKRFRPVLVYTAGKALGLDQRLRDAVAAAIEFVHAYSLIHDDLPAMDDDDLRRGRPTCHRAFDEATAILAGDALQALAFEILARELPPGSPRSMAAIRALAQACGSVGMAGGQALDLDAVGRAISEQALTRMHRLKTGALITASVTIPGILAGANADTLERLASYGEHIGLAFQVHDDILDVTGNSELTGKSTLADVALNKPTFPSILGMANSRRKAHELRSEAIFQIEHIDGDTQGLEWLADYVISRDR
ncbi:MAG: geranyl transferase [Xanthomonadales bacterium]|nr:polyprenyl synthetase family protein [Gammaproteobacteria bacterium]NNK50451.1 geranyl transferase [Xanthomonadales bacterium]